MDALLPTHNDCCSEFTWFMSINILKEMVYLTYNMACGSIYLCETQLISHFHELAFSHDQGIQTDLASMDFAKAFDMVPHKRLFYKLNWYGIQGDVHYWLVDFLSHHFQRVVLDGTPSRYIPVSLGVPQGTVLGPILFMAYINDLSEVGKNSTLRLFADGCIIYRLIKSTYDTEKLQKDIDFVLSWANVWQMKFNISKCCYMHTSQATKYKIRTQYNIHYVIHP